MNLVDRLERHAASNPDHPALVFEDQMWTYGELDHWVSDGAGGLRSLGVSPGTAWP